MKKLILLFLFPLTLAAQDKYAELLDSFMTAEANVRGFNGNVLVAKAGDIIYKKSFGYRNYDTKELLDENTVFEIASVSKQFTAVGILLLSDKGKLSLSDTLRKFFPELPYYNITVKNLITHTSGLPDYTSAMIEKWDRSKIAFNKDVIKFLADEKPPINFQPGKAFQYSNTGYLLMASIIEKVSGQSFKDYMHDNIFQPLRMNLSLVYNTRRTDEKLMPNYALGYIYSDKLKKYILPDSLEEYSYTKYLDGIVGDGIVNSTTGDMLKWDRALKNHTLLKEKTQQDMFTPQSLFDTTAKMSYGYGVFLDSTIYGRRIFHGGAWPGYSTNLTRIEDNDITVIMLSNNYTYTTTLACSLIHILEDKPFVTPYIHKEVVISEGLVNKYAGRYLAPNGYVIELIEAGGKLVDRRADKDDFVLKAESNTKFFFDDGSDTQIDFQLDDSGNVQKIYVIDNGAKIEIKRL